MTDAGATLDDLRADKQTELHEYIRAAHRYFARRLSGTADVDDCVSTTMYLVWGRMQDGKISDLADVYSLARGVLANARRADRRRSSLVEKVISNVSVDVDTAHEYDLLDQLGSVLSEGELELLLLVAWEELSLPEVAVVLNVRPATARKRYSRVREKARAGLLHDLLAPKSFSR